jgi:hypothetical protein
MVVNLWKLGEITGGRETKVDLRNENNEDDEED